RPAGLRFTGAGAAVRVADECEFDVTAVDGPVRVPAAILRAETRGFVYIRRRQNEIDPVRIRGALRGDDCLDIAIGERRPTRIVIVARAGETHQVAHLRARVVRRFDVEVRQPANIAGETGKTGCRRVTVTGC